MSTDEEIRTAFHTVFGPAAGGATTDPGIVSVIRRRHARQQRLLAVGAPLGVAAVTAGAVVGATAIHPGSGDDVAPASHGGSPTTQPTATVQTMQTVSLVGHNLALPSDWTLSGNRKLINLDTITPAQPVGGTDQSVTATSPDGAQEFDATVYTGPIASAERGTEAAADDPTFTHLVIDGHPAAIKVGNPSSGRCLMAHVPSGQTGPKGDVVESPCPKSLAANAPYGEARYTFGNGDFMLVDTNGMDAEALRSFLTDALS
jgi:hypothetical protein